MKTHRINTICPHCGAEHDRQSNVGSGKKTPPVAGDMGFCFECGEWHFFTETQPRKPTDEEYGEIADDTQCTLIRAKWLITCQPKVEAHMMVNGVLWEALNENLPDLGNLPDFLSAHDDRPAVRQLDSGYAFAGGWEPTPKFRFNPMTQMLRYPGDPTMRPLARATLRDETILLYPADWVVVAQEDGSFEVARMN
jgi:hypothetical protein